MRGIFATAMAPLKREMDRPALKALYEEAYGSEFFIRLVEGSPDVAAVKGVAAVEGEKLLVQYMGDRYPVTVAVKGSRSLFDPENTRVRS